jgi:hypothetical protein
MKEFSLLTIASIRICGGQAFVLNQFSRSLFCLLLFLLAEKFGLLVYSFAFTACVNDPELVPIAIE